MATVDLTPSGVIAPTLKLEEHSGAAVVDGQLDETMWLDQTAHLGDFRPANEADSSLPTSSTFQLTPFDQDFCFSSEDFQVNAAPSSYPPTRVASGAEYSYSAPYYPGMSAAANGMASSEERKRPRPTGPSMPTAMVAATASVGVMGSVANGNNQKFVRRVRQTRPKVVEAKGAVQCIGKNRKKGTQCRNAALMEYIGPRPAYCAEHIELDPASLYEKCKSNYQKEVGDGKNCKEVVLKEFGLCYKHYADLVRDIVANREMAKAQTHHDRILQLLDQLEKEASAAKKKDGDLYQRKNKLIPKFQEMKKVICTAMQQIRDGVTVMPTMPIPRSPPSSPVMSSGASPHASVGHAMSMSHHHARPGMVIPHHHGMQAARSSSVPVFHGGVPMQGMSGMSSAASISPYMHGSASAASRARSSMSGSVRGSSSSSVPYASSSAMSMPGSLHHQIPTPTFHNPSPAMSSSLGALNHTISQPFPFQQPQPVQRSQSSSAAPASMTFASHYSHQAVHASSSSSHQQPFLHQQVQQQYAAQQQMHYSLPQQPAMSFQQAQQQQAQQQAALQQKLLIEDASLAVQGVSTPMPMLSPAGSFSASGSCSGEEQLSGGDSYGSPVLSLSPSSPFSSELEHVIGGSGSGDDVAALDFARSMDDAFYSGMPSLGIDFNSPELGGPFN